MCPETSHVFPEDGSEPDFKEEALRRFANGASTASPDKLADIQTFLINQRFLTKGELEGDLYDAETALSLHRHLSSNSTKAREFLSKLPIQYVARQRASKVIERIAMTFSLDESGEYLRLESRYELFLDPQADLDLEELKRYRTDHNKIMSERRHGFGYVCTESNVLHLFLWGATQEDLVTYVQVPPFELFDTLKEMFVIRNGAYLDKRFCSEKRQDELDLQKNVFHFHVPKDPSQYDDSAELLHWRQQS